jgi:dolichol-phosphate mannosyltransferase
MNMNKDPLPVRPLISVVTPLWNEETQIPVLCARLQKLFSNTALQWQWVAVDDGSTDATASLVIDVQRSFPNAKLVCLSRNFGQQSAYRAGLDHADGDAVIFLDADLQDPPEYIPEMVEKWKSGAKLVVGCRSSRPEKGVRGFLLRMFHQVFFVLTGGAMPKNSGTFGLMDRIIVDHLKVMPEHDMFLPALRRWVGFQQDIVWYARQEREGQPRQTYAKLFRYAWDGITSFSEAPLKFITITGFLIFILGFGYASILFLMKIFQMFGFLRELVVQGFTTLAVAVFCLGGIQLLCLGIIGEYLARIYREVKGRPHYVAGTVYKQGMQDQ